MKHALRKCSNSIHPVWLQYGMPLEPTISSLLVKLPIQSDTFAPLVSTNGGRQCKRKMAGFISELLANHSLLNGMPGAEIFKVVDVPSASSMDSTCISNPTANKLTKRAIVMRVIIVTEWPSSKE